jgi:hypothetical protein
MPRISQDLSGVKDEDMNRDGGGQWYVKADGWYRAMYQASTWKPTKAGNGMVLGLDGMFLDPPDTGDKLLDFLTLQHPNATTVEIARVRLKELAIATGHPTPDYVENSDDLHRKTFMVRLYSEASDNPKYGDANGMQQCIGGYKSEAAWKAENGDDPAPAPPQSNSGQQEEPAHAAEDIPF